MRNNHKRIFILFGMLILMVPSIYLINIKGYKIKKLKEEASECIVKDDVKKALDIYKDIVERNEKDEEAVITKEALENYLESLKLINENKLEEAELYLNKINKSLLEDELKEKIDIIQEKVNKENSISDLKLKIDTLVKENEFIKAKKELDKLKKENLDSENKAYVESQIININEEHKKYKEKLKNKYKKEIDNLRGNYNIESIINSSKYKEEEKRKIFAEIYELWEIELKEVLYDLQKNLEEEKINELKEEQGIWRLNEIKREKSKKGIQENIEKIKSIEKHINKLIEKF